jgi:hypothetical protein
MHNQLENYLDRLNSNLSALPKERRKEEVEEMRQHLLSAFNAAIQNGMSDDSAAASAIEQFGPAEVVAHSTVLAWRRSGDTSFGAFAGAVGFSYCAVTMLESISFWIFWGRDIPPVEDPSNIALTILNQIMCIPWLAEQFLPCLPAAILIGLCYPRKAVSATLAAGTLSTIAGAITSFVLNNDHQGHSLYPPGIYSLLLYNLVVIPQYLLIALFAATTAKVRLQQLQQVKAG